MKELSRGERALVAIGAALGSNCVPCVEHYVGEARTAGFNDQQIAEATGVADEVRQVPAKKVLDAALNLVAGEMREGKCNESAKAPRVRAADGKCCG
jgi:4-carboxymuconolactone decarboxylase